MYEFRFNFEDNKKISHNQEMIEPNTPVATNSKKAKQQNDDEGNYDEGSITSYENPALNLPKSIINRVNALKNIQLKMVNIETKFYEELHQLECKYSQMFEPLFDERNKIVVGEYEPTGDEIKWPYEDIFKENDQDLADELKDKANLNEQSGATTTQDDLKGIPGFWLQAFKNTDIIGEMIQEHDEQVLQHLVDIRCKMNNQKPFGYILEFHFEANEFFSNRVLTKSYDLAIDLNQDDKDPLSYDGPIIYKCQGCTINWLEGKDVTVKLVKKKQKHKGTGTIRVVTKEEKQDSFFNFFDAPTEDGYRPSYRHYIDPNVKDDEDIDDELEQLCEADFELGHFFKEFMIPKAVLYFTGELVDEANSFDEGDYDEEDEDFDDDEHDEDDYIQDLSSIKGEEDNSSKSKNKNKNKPSQLTQRNVKK